MKTKEKILHTAIELFMSPGRPKCRPITSPASVRAICITIFATRKKLSGGFSVGFIPVGVEVPVFYRELVILVKNVPELALTHQSMQDSRVEEQLELFQAS